ncbi:MAG TPA: phosphatase PAP2 family protein [Hanamia sp.]
MSLFEFLKRLDRILFVLIHNDSQHKVLDEIMLVVINHFTWIPIYIFVLFFIVRKTGNRAWYFIVLSILTVAIADGSSIFILNPLFARLSPCFDPEIHEFVRGIIDCREKYSFPSAQVANYFGIAAFWFWSLLKITGIKWNWLWVWASLIGYAEIYIGNDFPSDVAAGALLGIFIGIVIAKTYEYINKG